MRSQDVPMCPFNIKAIAPAFASGSKPVFMGSLHIFYNILRQIFCILWLFYVIALVNVPCRMELRHEQCVHIPEIAFDNRPCHLLKSKGNELQPYLVKEPPVVLLSSCKYLRNINFYVKAPELLAFP